MIKHSKVSLIADGADTTVVRPSDWNADHDLKESGGQSLTLGGIADGKVVKRVGTELVGVDIAGATVPTGTGFRHVTADVEDAVVKLVENVDVATTAAIVESKLSLNFPTHSNINDPITDQKAALAGTSGTPSITNKYVTNEDPRNTNARTPTTHIHDVANIITVAAFGADYTNINDAVDYIAGLGVQPSETNQYTIKVAPGSYPVGKTIVGIPYVSIVGEGGYYITNLYASPTGLDVHLIQGINNFELKDISLTGSTASNRACVYYTINSTSPMKLESVVLKGGFYGVYADGSALTGSQKARVHCINVVNQYKAGNNFDRLFYALGRANITCISSGGMSGPSGAINIGFCATKSGDGIGEITADGCFFRNSTGTGFHSNGGFIRANACTVGDAAVAFHANGAGGTIYATGCYINNNIAIQFKTENVADILEYSGSACAFDNQRSIFTGSTFSANVTDVTTGEFYLIDTDGSIPLKTYTKDTASTGWVSGGNVTKNATARVLDVTSGVGIVNNTISTKIITWTTTQKTAIDNTELQYIYVDVDNTVQISSIEPDITLNVVLAVVDAKDNDIVFIADHRIPVAQVVPSVSEYVENVIGPLSITGGNVTEHSPGTTVELIVDGGTYNIGYHTRTFIGANPAPIYTMYRDGIGGYTQDKNIYQTANTFPYWDDGNNNNLDNNTGSGKFVRHLLFVTYASGNEYYYLVVGQERFDSQILAEAGNNPLVPTSFLKYSLRLAAIIMADSGLIVSIVDQRAKIGQSATSSTAITDHNSLSGKQGGVAGQYYHLDTSQVAKVNVINTTGDSSSYLAANGIYYTIPPGGVVVQGSGTYVHTSGTVQFNNANGITFGLSNNGVMTASHNGITQQTGNFLSTNADTAYAKNSLFAGTNISGTLNSTTFALSVAASGNSTSFGSQSATPSQSTGATSVLANNGAWVTVVTTLGNYLSSNASTAFVINSLFGGTNISGTLNSTTFALSVAAPLNSTSFGSQSATPSQSTGATSVLANNGAWITVITTLGNYISTAGSTSFGYQSATPSQTTGASSVLYNNGAWQTVAAGGGIQSINGQSATAQTITVQSGLALSTATNAWTFGLSSNYTNASYVVTSGASSSFLAADGTYRTIAGGSVTNNYTGVVAHGLSDSTTNNATFGSIWYQGTNLTVNLTTNANSSHTMNFSVAASGNSTSFGSQSATPSQTTGQRSVLWNNGAWNSFNAIAMGLSESTTNNATGGTIWMSGSNVTVGLTTNANGSHILSFSANDSQNTGFNLGGNTSGSSSFGNTTSERITYAATQGLYVSGTSNNALTYGIQANSGRVDFPQVWAGPGTGSVQIVTGSAYYRNFQLMYPLYISRVDVPMFFQVTTTAASTQSYTLSGTLVIYTNNANTLTPVAGVLGASMGMTWGSSGNPNSNFTGSRWVSLGLTTTLTPGDYWVGLKFNTATGGNALAKTDALIINNSVVSVNTGIFNFGAASANSLGWTKGVGIVAWTTTGTSASSIPFSSFTGFTTAIGNAMFPIIFNNF